MLDLAPTIEHTIVERAEAGGMTTDEYLSKLLANEPTGSVLPSSPGATAAAPADDPVWALLRAQIAEAENATPEEIAAHDAGYRLWQQNMDAPRRANGERLLFPEAPKR